MTQHEGFLVVQAHPNDLGRENPRYRGIDRTPPFSMTKMEEGFEDPLVFGGVTGDAGLIVSAPLARQVKSQFETNEPREELEIVVARACNGAPAPPPEPAARFLGFDVAGTTSPFYSIVGDFGPEPELEPFRAKLNAAGLFDSAADAKAYLDVYRAHQLPDHDLPFGIWQVWLAEQEKRAAAFAAHVSGKLP